MSISEKIKSLADTLAPEETKARSGNHSAGVRARKILMEIKKAAGEGREEISKAVTEVKK